MKELAELLAVLGFCAFLLIVTIGIIGAAIQFWIDLVM